MVRFSDDSYDESFITTIGVDFKLKTIELEDDNKLPRYKYGILWDNIDLEQ